MLTQVNPAILDVGHLAAKPHDALLQDVSDELLSDIVAATNQVHLQMVVRDTVIRRGVMLGLPNSDIHQATAFSAGYLMGYGAGLTLFPHLTPDEAT